jgi:tetratricopeptide (TPR) repeat protein
MAGKSMTARSPEALAAARQQWLAGLALAHRREPSAASALELARGAWRCGDYDAALLAFADAAARAPSDEDCQLAYIRALSMLGRVEAETRALQSARARLPESRALRLQAALQRVADDPNGALELLSPWAQSNSPEEAWPRLLRDALLTLSEAEAPRELVDARFDPWWESFRWVHARARPQAFVGLPIQVLQRALQLAPADGLTLECGVYFGRSLRVIAECSSGKVHGFDSFEGLPEAWKENEGAGAYSTGGLLPLGLPERVRLHPGWFEQTLPPFFASEGAPIRLLHVDCDLYSSTRTVLDAADPFLVAGSVVVFDDLLGYPGYAEHELRALCEWSERSGARWEVVAACLLGREVAIRILAR